MMDCARKGCWAKMGEKRNWVVETVLKTDSRFRIQIKEI
jgi:hypothetical protein